VFRARPYLRSELAATFRHQRARRHPDMKHRRARLMHSDRGASINFPPRPSGIGAAGVLHLVVSKHVPSEASPIGGAFRDRPHRGIRVNGVAPGPTHLIGMLLTAVYHTPENKAACLVAGFRWVLFLASSENLPTRSSSARATVGVHSYLDLGHIRTSTASPNTANLACTEQRSSNPVIRLRVGFHVHPPVKSPSSTTANGHYV